MVVSKWLLVPAAVLLLAVCQQKSETAGAAPESCRTGTQLGADGHVAQTKSSFGAGERIFITVVMPAGTEREQLTVEIDDAKGEEVKSLFKQPSDEKIVTFPLRNLSAGRYTARATAGKEKICETAFEIH